MNREEAKTPSGVNRVNHPITNPTHKVTGLTSISLIIDDLEQAADTPSRSEIAPIDQDILNEEQAAIDGRKGTPDEIYDHLTKDTKHTTTFVNALEFSKWLKDRDWPEEFCLNRDGYLIKVFQAHDGFAVKMVPRGDLGQLMAHLSIFKVRMFTK